MTISHQTTQEDISNLLNAWGWSKYTEEMEFMAGIVCDIRQMRAGEAVVRMGLCDEITMDEIMSKKPSNIPTVEWLTRNLESVRNASQKVLGMHGGYQYFDHFDFDMEIHAAMKQAEVAKKCEEMDAILYVIEKTKPVLIFSDYLTMLRHIQMGRHNSMNDPILKAIKIDNPDVDKLIYALGDRQKIIQLIRIATEGGSMSVEEVSGTVWIAGQAQTEAQRKLTRILDDAILRNVTDISIVPGRDGRGRIFYRLFGELVDSNQQLNYQIMEEMTRFLLVKTMANPDGGRLTEPRGGQLTYRSGVGEVFIRASFIPDCNVAMDFDMVSIDLRLLPKKFGLITLGGLNMPPKIITEIKHAVSFSQGLIVLAGPTNSGKSTTIAGMVGEHIQMFGKTRKRISIEDPVERYLPDIFQVNVPNHIPNGFAMFFKEVLRHDPDLIWVGEIRDEEVANTCVNASISGHIVFTTVHANDTILGYRAIAKRVRKDDQFDLVESLAMIVGQRLVRRICQQCSTEYRAPSAEETASFTYYCKQNGFDPILLPKSVRVPNSHGCEQCTFGFDNVLPINEVLPVGREVKNLMLSDKFRHEDIAKFRVSTLFESGLELVNAGLTEIGDILV